MYAIRSYYAIESGRMADAPRETPGMVPPAPRPSRYRGMAVSLFRTSDGFTVIRVLMQDFTGVPAVVDLAAMRDAMETLGGDPQRINPLVPVDLVIDHSVIVDEFRNNFV